MGDTKGSLPLRMARDAKPLLVGEAMHVDPWESELEEAAAAWIVLNEVKQRAEDRLKLLRERLLEEVTCQGAITEKLGYELKIGETLFRRERRQDTIPNVDAIRELLDKKSIPMNAALTKKTSYVVDPSKLSNLVETGKLEESEVNECRKVNWALKTYGPLLFLETEEEPEATPRAKRMSATGARKR